MHVASKTKSVPSQTPPPGLEEYIEDEYVKPITFKINKFIKKEKQFLYIWYGIMGYPVRGGNAQTSRSLVW